MATVLQALADPTLVYALFVVGCCGLLAELVHPGALFPGISGGVCLFLAVVGFAMLPPNWVSLLLIVGALGLFALDAKVTTHGGPAAAGLAAFAAGSLTLFGLPGSKAPTVSLPVIAVLMLAGAALCMFLVRAAMRAKHAPALNGPQRLLGESGVVTSDLQPSGTVRVAGELWSARLCRGGPTSGIGRRGLEPRELPRRLSEDTPMVLPAGRAVRVVGRRGLVLEVEPVASAGGGAARTA